MMSMDTPWPQQHELVLIIVLDFPIKRVLSLTPQSVSRLITSHIQLYSGDFPTAGESITIGGLASTLLVMSVRVVGGYFDRWLTRATFGEAVSVRQPAQLLVITIRVTTLGYPPRSGYYLACWQHVSDAS